VKEGDLVKFVGVANFYKNRIGVVCRLYSTHGIKKNGVQLPNSALVYFAGAEQQGRATPYGQGRTSGRHRSSGLHPMALDELKLINNE